MVAVWNSTALDSAFQTDGPGGEWPGRTTITGRPAPAFAGAAAR
jgi:hypothetical protein